MGQQTTYSWDLYGRLTAQYFSTTVGGTPDPNQTVLYSYDTNVHSPGFSNNAQGRLTTVQMNTNMWYDYNYRSSLFRRGCNRCSMKSVRSSFQPYSCSACPSRLRPIQGGVYAMASLGISYISEQLTNKSPGFAKSQNGAWCASNAGAVCPDPGDLNDLTPSGTFIDYLEGQGSATQSFYLNGTGAALQVLFPPSPGFVGPVQPVSFLNNVYNSNPPSPSKNTKPVRSVIVAGGAFSSAGQPPCAH
jgi:hypothetical protein